jgi:hypothetical protein
MEPWRDVKSSPIHGTLWEPNMKGSEELGRLPQHARTNAVIWAKRKFNKSTDDYGPYQERFADLHRDLCAIAGMMMVKADKGPYLCRWRD